MLRRLKQLEDENQKLKQPVADLRLDKHILQDVLLKKSEACPATQDLPVCPVEPGGQRAAQLRSADL